MTVQEKAELIIRDINKNYNVSLEYEHLCCDYSNQNAQCIGERCPFHKVSE